MKTRLLLAFATFAALTAALYAQEPAQLSPEELSKATALLMDANTRLGDLPLKLELAPDQSIGLKAGEAGALLIPDKRLKIEKAQKGDKSAKKKAKGEAVPVGQLWTSKLAPKDNDAVLPNDKLRLTKITAGDKEMELAVFALGIERAGKKEFHLALYGKGSSPVLRVPLTASKSKGAAPVLMSARKTGEESGVLELLLLGRFKAEIPVGKMAE
ncbi:MAG: hypothetical protein HZA92_16075 [Verrucomicrobia bacterium]|nr:hypothetical protein [Verrucomicrobiota bacterium]